MQRISALRTGARAVVARAVCSVPRARPSIPGRVPSFPTSSNPFSIRAFSTSEAKAVSEEPAASDAVPPASETSEEHERKIYVGNIAWKVQSQDLEKHFSQWGEVLDARVIMDRENPFRSRGFGFVTFSKKADAEDAAKMNNEKEWLGRNIRVNISTPRAPRSNYGGGGSFGGGSGGYGGGRGQIRRDD